MDEAPSLQLSTGTPGCHLSVSEVFPEDGQAFGRSAALLGSAQHGCTIGGISAALAKSTRRMAGVEVGRSLLRWEAALPAVG
jgi:hypothetical protein